MTSRGAVALLARAFTRSQWKGLLVAVVLLAVGGSATFAALAGARRTSTTADRALDAVDTADVSVDVSSIARERLEVLRGLPEVEDLSAFAYTPIRPVGSGLVPGIDVVGILPLDDRSGRTMDRPRLTAGRLPDPERGDEALINDSLAGRLDLRVGDTLELEGYSQSELLAVFEGAEPAAPTGARGDVRVVGIGRDLTEVAFPDDSGFGVVVLSHGWFERFDAEFVDIEQYDSDVGLFRVLLRARLQGGDAAVEPFLDEVYSVYADQDASTLFSEARSDVFGDTEATLRVESLALLLCALAAGVATVAAVAQTLTRQQFLAAARSVPVAVAVGLPRRARVVSLLVPTAGAVAVGLGVALVVAGALSPAFPRGLGDRLEPDPGVHLDGLALLLGAITVGALIVAVCLTGAVRSSRTAAEPSALVPRLRMPLGRPEVGVGIRMAFHAGRGSTRVPARQTVLGAAVGVAGVVAAVTFAASLNRLVDTPRLYGEDYDTTAVFQGDTGEQAVAAQQELVGDGRIAGLTRYGLGELTVGGEQVTAVFHEVLKGSPGIALLAGRAPASPTELALNPSSLPGDGPDIGDVLTVSGDGEPVEVRVVGHLTGTTDSVVMTEGGARRLGMVEYAETGFNIRWSDGVDEASARSELLGTFAEVYPVRPTESISNLERVSGFPYAVAALLAVLAVAAVGHLLASGVRRRGRDLAVLKVLGFSRRRTRATVHWQAVTVMVVGVGVGVVLGTVAGRGAWALVTSSLDVIYAPSTPPGALLAVAGLALFVTLGVAAVPARSAARTRPVVALRTE